MTKTAIATDPDEPDDDYSLWLEFFKAGSPAVRSTGPDDDPITNSLYDLVGFQRELINSLRTRLRAAEDALTELRRES